MSTSPETPPVLVGDRVRLRPFHDDDEALWAMVNEEGNRLTGDHATFTRDAVERWSPSAVAG